MTAGTQTVQAEVGLFYLDDFYEGKGDEPLTGASIYVPARSVGTRRVPLLVLLPGSGMSGLDMINVDQGVFKQFADSTGIILLALSENQESGEGLDTTIQTMLHHYAIDPAKIALLGVSAGSKGALDFGYVNGDVFSRAILLAGFATFAREHEFDGIKTYGKAAFYIGMNPGESTILHIPEFAEWMRHQGHSVTVVEDSGGHYLTVQRATSALNWLVKSWQWKVGR